MRYFLICLTITIIISACKTKENEFTIVGHIDGINDTTLVTLYNLEQQFNLDSSYSVNGDFILKGNVEYPTACWLMCEDEYAIIQVENVDMSFKSPINDMHLNYSAKGGREQELQNELNRLQRPYDLIYYDAYDSLINNKFENENEKQNLIKRFNESQSKSRKIYIKFGIDNFDSYLGQDIVYRNRNSISKDTLTRIFEALPDIMKETPTANALAISLFEETAMEGDLFIDFEVETIDEENFQLSSLKGNYIYLCFWSAGCGACRLENQFINSHFEEIPDNLSIVSFSIDKNREAWKTASKNDAITWYNISDQEGERGSIKTRYQVQATPTSFLIAPSGKIIRKFVGFDPDVNLIDELKNIIEENES